MMWFHCHHTILLRHYKHFSPNVIQLITVRLLAMLLYSFISIFFNCFWHQHEIASRTPVEMKSNKSLLNQVLITFWQQTAASREISFSIAELSCNYSIAFDGWINIQNIHHYQTIWLFVAVFEHFHFSSFSLSLFHSLSLYLCAVCVWLYRFEFCANGLCGYLRKYLMKFNRKAPQQIDFNSTKPFVMNEWTCQNCNRLKA